MTTPSAVQGLVVSPSDGSVTLNWRAPLSNGGSVITGYQLEYCTPWCATPATLAENNIDPLATSFTLNGLTNGSTYNFRLRARTAAGLDPNGATVSSVPVRIPGIVDTLTASTQVVGTGAAQATYVTLSWAARLRKLRSRLVGPRTALPPERSFLSVFARRTLLGSGPAPL
jgi:titin